MKRAPEEEEVAQQVHTLLRKSVPTAALEEGEVRALFPQQPVLCERLCAWTRVLFKTDTLRLDQLQLSVSLLLCEPASLSHASLHALPHEPLLTFLALCGGAAPNALTRVSAEEAEAFFAMAFSVLQCTEGDASKAAKLLRQSLCEGEACTALELVQRVKEQLPCLGAQLRQGIKGALTRAAPLVRAELSNGGLLSSDLYVLLRASNYRLGGFGSLDLIYSTRLHGFSFNRLAHALNGFEGPLLLLVRNSYQLMERNCSDVFGAFTNCSYAESFAYFGRSETYLFRLRPTLRNFFPGTPRARQPNVYFNTKRIPQSRLRAGLGFFGDEDYNNFALWIDAEMTDKSYVRDVHPDAADRHLTNAVDAHLTIVSLEVWAGVSPEALAKQQSFRELQQEAAARRGRADKKEFFGSGPMNTVMLEKSFGFKKDLHIDLDREKKELEK